MPCNTAFTIFMLINRLNIHRVPNPFWLLFLSLSFTSLSIPLSLRAGSQVISPSWIPSHRLFGSSCCWLTSLSAVCFFFLLGTHKCTLTHSKTAKIIVLISVFLLFSSKNIDTSLKQHEFI